MINAPQQPPNIPEAERAVLGACLVSKEALGNALEILRPDDFYGVYNRKLFEVLSAMYIADKPADFVTVQTELTARGIFSEMGGQPFLAQLAANVTTTSNVTYHAEIISESSVRRKLLAAADEINSMALNNALNTKEIIERAEKLIFEASQNKNSTEFRHVKDVISPVFINVEERYNSHDDKDRSAGFLTGFTDLDGYTGGLQPGSLTIIAARPSMGKTAFAVNIAQFGGGNKNLPVLIFSLEMPAEQLVMRMMSAASGINLSVLSKGTFDTLDYEHLKETCSILAEQNIFINDDSNLTAVDFRTRCRRFKTRHPNLALVIVDYLQLMSSGDRRPSDGRQQEVSDISRMLKAAARELNCPVIALSQLSRAAEQRTEKKPQLSDLRDSGAIEQDADVVLLMFREDYYSENENNDLEDSKADIRVAKNRNGSTGVFHLIFKREFTRFLNFREEMKGL
ncbi:MAG: replicative DNA helicase [Synergistaceae bacterium]|nr:replicative DNA helicase [Synergistaceae bacterium]